MPATQVLREESQYNLMLFIYWSLQDSHAKDHWKCSLLPKRQRKFPEYYSWHQACDEILDNTQYRSGNHIRSFVETLPFFAFRVSHYPDKIHFLPKCWQRSTSKKKSEGECCSVTSHKTYASPDCPEKGRGVRASDYPTVEKEDGDLD